MSDDFTPAALRAAGLRSITQRPTHRRNSSDGGGRGVVRAPLSSPLQVREAAGESGLLTFAGVASVTERAYPMWDVFGEYSEVIDAAAFDETLARADLDVTLVLGHDQMRRIARTTLGTLRLSASEGLAVDADLDPDDPDVAYAAPKLRSGLYDEMSFAFRIESGQWSPDYSEFRITKVDLHRGDVSIVGWGANPYTSGGLRSRRADDTSRHMALLDLAIATG